MERGQATTEYVGVIALVALILTLAGAVAAPDLPKTLVRQFRLGLCMVGGDVCRTADARARGLEPCVVSALAGQEHTRVTIVLASYLYERGFAIERRSDGTRRVTTTENNAGGVEAAVGLKLGPQVDVGAEASGEIGFVSGGAWELPDEAALQRFLRGMKPGPAMSFHLLRRGIRPTEVFRGGSGSARAGAGSHVLGLEQAFGETGGRAVIGRRIRNGRTSWFLDASHVGASLFGGLIAEVSLRRPGAWVLELSDRPRELRLSTTVPGEGDTRVELEARLDLTVPANAAVVRELLDRPSRERARAIGRHMVTAGSVERRVYRVRRRPIHPDLGAKVGGVGVAREHHEEERTLVAAEVLRDGRSARRADCLGL